MPYKLKMTDLRIKVGTFLLAFVISFVAAALVTLAWSAIFHGRLEVNFGISFVLAMIFGLISAFRK